MHVHHLLLLITKYIFSNATLRLPTHHLYVPVKLVVIAHGRWPTCTLASSYILVDFNSPSSATENFTRLT